MTDSSDVIQTEVLSELKDILAEEFPVLIDTYLEDAGERLVKLRTAVDSADAPGIKIEAHSLKGSSINLGVTGLASLCAKMEDCGTSQQLDDTAQLFNQIQSEFSRAEDLLRQQL